MDEKEMKRGEGDSLSDLPDHLLHHIFSFLTTTDLIRSTSLLSKKWHRYWVSFPYLNFTLDCTDECSSTCLPEFVNNALRLRDDASVLQRFRLHWPNCKDPNLATNWIVTALGQSVHELDIFVGNFNTFLIPLEVFMSSSTVTPFKIGISGCAAEFIVREPFYSAPNLRTLELTMIKLRSGNSEEEDQLVLNFRVLETLVMKNCYYNHLKVLNLSSHRLKRLVIDNGANVRVPPSSNCLGECKLELYTPSLSSFVYKGGMFKDCSIGSFRKPILNLDLSLIPRVITSSSHEESSLDRIVKAENYYASNFLKRLNCAGGLDDERALARKRIKVSPEVQDVSKELRIANLKMLVLITVLNKDSSVTWLASLLDRCSFIKKLVLRVIKVRWEPTLPIYPLPIYPLDDLKYVAIKILKGHDRDLELLQFFFENAVNPEKIIITGYVPESLLLVHDKLMTLSNQFPKVSFEFL